MNVKDIQRGVRRSRYVGMHGYYMVKDASMDTDICRCRRDEKKPHSTRSSLSRSHEDSPYGTTEREENLLISSI